ncbi:hypothetical protein PILCRDRAFT_603129 [Piloderma croceum F 1598]|uniref:Uncharacterized protein n=1 Tax=Piloderma croceum (strain F 1598) TaxID=765440 RepID=A0A0C3EZX8_PILCF|nr:hypothetical protein PILCRDRAFT_603129 [Piloderma croceum F 1598]
MFICIFQFCLIKAKDSFCRVKHRPSSSKYTSINDDLKAIYPHTVLNADPPAMSIQLRRLQESSRPINHFKEAFRTRGADPIIKQRTPVR